MKCEKMLTLCVLSGEIKFQKVYFCMCLTLYFHIMNIIVCLEIPMNDKHIE